MRDGCETIWAPAESNYNEDVHSRILICAVTTAVLVSVGCSGGSPTSAAAAVKPEAKRRPAPDFSLKDAMGRAVTLAEYKGKVVLLNFWATWCGPCKIEIPWFVEFEQKYKDKGFAVLGVSMDEEGFAVVRPFVDKNQINYRMVIGNDSVAQQYGGVDALPSSFIIDKEGRIAATHVGLVSKGEYARDIDALLGIKKSGVRRDGAPVLALFRAE